MKKTKPKSLMREVAYERFKAQLFKRNLVPGQFVSQGELCELLDVPLGPTREALKRLEAESLVRLIPQRGIQIADIGVTLIREAFEFRTVLEVAAVRRFTASASAETIDKLERDTRGMLERMASATEPDSRMLDAALQGFDQALRFWLQFVAVPAGSRVEVVDLYTPSFGQRGLMTIERRGGIDGPFDFDVHPTNIRILGALGRIELAPGDYGYQAAPGAPVASQTAEKLADSTENTSKIAPESEIAAYPGAPAEPTALAPEAPTPAAAPAPAPALKPAKAAKAAAKKPVAAKKSAKKAG